MDDVMRAIHTWILLLVLVKWLFIDDTPISIIVR
jgi:hypothetical protein